MKEKLLTTREISHIVGISEKELIDLANANRIPHYKVAGEFLRFKKEDVARIKPIIKKKYNVTEKKYHYIERMREFFYFKDFYIISTAVIVFLLWVIVKDIVFSG